MNLGDLLDEPIAAVPSRAAFILDDVAISYEVLGHAVTQAAAALSARGVGAGDRVAVVDAASVLATASVLGCARIGAAAVPMSPRLTPAEIAVVASAANCGSVAVAGVGVADRVAEAIGAGPLGEDDLLRGDAVRGPSIAVSPDDVAVVLLTSGTTGVPKPVPFSHGVLEQRIRSFTVAPDPAREAPVSILCVPFHHVAGLIGVLVGLAGGGTAVLQRRFDAGEWLKLVERHRVQRAFLVPTMLRRILDHPNFARADLGSLQMITYGAAPAAAELVARAVDALPDVAFVQVFGQTETLGAVTALTPDDHRVRPASVGKPLPGVDVRIVDPAGGNDVADGEVGEFWARAPHTATSGWVRSGDLVRRDADGYLYVVGRLSDVINRGGEKIDPAEIEDVLRSHPTVADAAVCGIADEELGESVAGVVVARHAVEPQALQAWCSERLAPYKVPQQIVFVDELPLTELGKVSRRALRALFGGG